MLENDEFIPLILEGKKQVNNLFERKISYFMDSLPKNESKYVTDQRHKEYLYRTLNDPKAIVARQLLSLVDKIHSAEVDELNNKLGLVQSELKSWQVKQQEPVCFDAVIQHRIEKNTIAEEKKLQFKERLENMNFKKVQKAKLEELSRICKEYNIKDFTKNPMELNRQQCLNNFVEGIQDSFSAYKKQASLERAYLKAKLKDREGAK